MPSACSSLEDLWLTSNMLSYPFFGKETFGDAVFPVPSLLLSTLFRVTDSGVGSGASTKISTLVAVTVVVCVVPNPSFIELTAVIAEVLAANVAVGFGNVMLVVV